MTVALSGGFTTLDALAHWASQAPGRKFRYHGNRVTLIDGQRRWTACEESRIKSAAVVLEAARLKERNTDANA